MNVAATQITLCRFSFYTKDFIKSFLFEVLSTLDVWTGPQSHFRNIEKKSLGIYKEFLNISIYNVLYCVVRSMFSDLEYIKSQCP